jgi:hypothetical protein
MTNVHMNIESVRNFAEKLDLRAQSLTESANDLIQVTMTLAQSWEDDQYKLFYDDSRRLVSLLQECVRHCEFEKRRLETIIAAAEAIKY